MKASDLKFAAVLYLALLLWPCSAVGQGHKSALEFSAPEKPFPIFYQNKGPFEAAIKKSQALEPYGAKISGLTMPHHLLAADLIAQGFSRLKTHKYKRLIILAPDHYRRGQKPVSIPARDFESLYGLVKIDREMAADLKQSWFVGESALFSHEHSVQALIPFIAHYFPDVSVMPICLSISSNREQWDALSTLLAPWLDDETLIIQSTDYSHFLPQPQALRKDKETLRLLSTGLPEIINFLDQPLNVDSKAAQYVQMKLQKDFFKAVGTVVENRNALHYLPQGEQEPRNTTSYILEYYSPEALPLPSTLPRYIFAGDFFTGRYLQPILERGDKREQLIKKVLRLSQGAPIILNFEGVLRESCPPVKKHKNPTPQDLCLPQALTLELLKDLNVIAVSLANNHSHDLGQESYNEMRQTLSEAGFLVLENGQVHDFKHFKLLTLTDLKNKQIPGANLIRPQDIPQELNSQIEENVFALVHAGREFIAKPSQREKYLSEILASKGVSLYIGTHHHKQGPLTADIRQAQAWSLGNFLFDQSRSDADGALLEVVFFTQGSYWLRLVDLGNLYSDLK